MVTKFAMTLLVFGFANTAISSESHADISGFFDEGLKQSIAYSIKHKPTQFLRGETEAVGCVLDKAKAKFSGNIFTNVTQYSRLQFDATISCIQRKARFEKDGDPVE